MSLPPRLKRSITLPFLIFYGLGTMVGGGFYALLGVVLQEAGSATPFALLLTGLLALLSACSFAELSSRYPVSAGEAHYVREGFGHTGFSTVVGWLVVLTGLVSAATLAVACIAFLEDRFTLHSGLGIFLLVLAMGMVAGWGIGQSVGVVTAITFIEVGALLYILGINVGAFAEFPTRTTEIVPSWGAGSGSWLGVFSGAFLAFYAFIGFEDMVNMAEEVKNVRRTLPIAILVSIALTTVLYVAVALAVVLSGSTERLAESSTPIAELASGQGWMSTTGIWLVSLLAGLNGALVQIIMSSRVAYGMAERNQAPRWFAVIHPRTRTPLRATLAMTIIILVLALFFPLTTLARTTSAIILLVFAAVNLALWRIKKSDPNPACEGPRFPRWLSLAGFVASLLVVAFQVWLTLTA
jgi:APA family basic amino acid/polyamine antiporter